MKVLDVGCHDGYIGAWLKERFDGDLTIDGVELHPGACDIARRRGYRKVVQAAAEAVADHLKPHSYDAVVAYELIEHVPDPDKLLAALEHMLAPGGRVYISTPDGTFGAGSNPHHLRAYTALSLADTLRRRGSIEQMTVGQDTIAVAAYTPVERRGEVAVFTGPSLMPWAPFDIETKGLGGSETAAVRLSEALARLGYIVTVYGDMQDEGCHADVIFRRWESFDPSERRLAVIASRIPEVYERPVNAQCRLLWMHDTDCGPRLTETFADRIDRVLVLSDWHRRHVEGLYPFLRRDDREAPSKVVQTRNGIHLPYFAREGKRKRRLLYTSSPDRGLDVLLELWPQIRKKAPRATLAWCYSPVYFDAAKSNPALQEHTAKIEKLSKQPGVEVLGSLPQHELAKLMRESLVWAAPSWCTPAGAPFHETSCIGAMEAQAAGLVVVASGWGALPETVKVGALVNGDPPGEKWRRNLVEEIVRGLADKETQAHAQREGPKAVAQLGWQPVAEQFAALFEGEAL